MEPPIENISFQNYSELPEDATLADIERIMMGGEAEAKEKDRGTSDETGKSERSKEPKKMTSASTRVGKQLSFLSTIKSSIFPAKLYEILADPRYNEIIRWLPHGRSWEVLDKKAFINQVAPEFFSFSKYTSFIRQITGWCFRRVTSGPDRNSYYHELFMRGKPQLIKFMKREVAGIPKPDESKCKDPNFYELSRKYPLPPLPAAAPQYVGDKYLQQSTSYSGILRGHPQLPNNNHKMYPSVPPPILIDHCPIKTTINECLLLALRYNHRCPGCCSRQYYNQEGHGQSQYQYGHDPLHKLLLHCTHLPKIPTPTAASGLSSPLHPKAPGSSAKL